MDRISFKKIAFSVCFLFLVIGNLSAKHIVGGEISYKNIGGNNYEIKVSVYRDCTTGVPFDDPLYFTVFDSSGNAILSQSIPFPGSQVLPLYSGNICLSVPPNLCVDEATYIDTILLPPVPGGYTIVYQRCCRSNTILNINNPGVTGATYIATIPDSSLEIGNSSPIFNSYPPIVICVNEPLSIDQSATDPDGDSLVYSLFNPFQGASSSAPEPTVANPPPFTPLNFITGYSYANPMGGSPPLSIDPQTGLLTITPKNIGQFIVGVCVYEYRHGKLLGIHYRDFQFNVVDCNTTSKVAAAFTSNDSASQVTFNSSTSIGAVSYNWNFGDGGTDSIANPVHTYNSPGSYEVCLRVYNDSGCSSVQCRTVVAGVPASCNAYFVYYLDTVIPHHWFVINESTGKSPIEYLWNWGDGTTSTGQTPSHIYSNAGYFSISLKITDDTSCTNTFRDSLSYFFRLEGDIPVTITVIENSITNVSNISSTNHNLSVFPNPCKTCNIEGVDNATDISLTDLLGRNIDVSFTKNTSGGVISLPDNKRGFFILRNLKTGKVVRFVSE